MTARLSAALPVIAILVLAGCGTGKDAVATGGEFQFVAPGGQTSIFYDPPAQRGALHGLSGESLLEPGRMIGPSDAPGQVVVINIWGSWCGPCRTELPELQRVYEQNRTSGVAFLGIDVRDSRDAAGDFVRDRGVAFPSIFDAPGRSLAALHGYPRNTVPSTIVLDRSHRVAAVFLTTVRVAELQPLLSRLAAEPAG
jgi:thiol-disulfide isomerase/thioredoxin